MQTRHRKQGGFTLLEVMAATAIMGIAVAALLANLQMSLRNSARAREAEKIPFVAQHEMDRLLTEPPPNFEVIRGRNDTGVSWTAEASPFEYQLHPAAGTLYLQRIQLRLHWSIDGKEHSYRIEGFRQNTLTQQDSSRLNLTSETPR